MFEWFRAAIVVCALAVVLSGCSDFSFSFFGHPLSWPSSGSQEPAGKDDPPRIQDCTIVNGATGDQTQTQYLCNGKVYSGRELYKLREDPGSK